MIGSGPVQTGSTYAAVNVPLPPPTAPITSATTLSRSASQRSALDSTAGAFAVRLPLTPNVGDVVTFEDWGNFIATNNVTLSTGAVAMQSPHTGVVSAVSTTIAAGSNGASLPQATINCASTTGFPSAGMIGVTTAGGVQAVTYTGKTGTTFTGCTGGTGAMSTGGAVISTSYLFGSNEGNGSTLSFTYAYDSLLTPTYYWKVV